MQTFTPRSTRTLFFLPLLLLLASCHSGPRQTGSIEVIDSALNTIVDPNTPIEVLAEGMIWSEGPLWLEGQHKLIWSDVPANTIYQWTEEKGKEVWLTPSGYTSPVKRGGETGSNGLVLDRQGRLVLCQHGNRQLARMNATLDAPKPDFVAISEGYQSKKFNSPNDAVYNSKGELFFTDPPYGLEKNMQDPKKELPYQGVYKVNAQGHTILLTDSITRPNGIALSPDEKTLFIANSDSSKPYWYAFQLGDGDSLLSGRIFYDVSVAVRTEKGVPDGMKIDRNGNIFAGGPGGLWIFNKDARVLGKLKIAGPVSNCNFSPDQKILYITANHEVLRLRLK